MDNVVGKELGNGDQGEGCDSGGGRGGTDNLQEWMEESWGIKGANVFAGLEDAVGLRSACPQR